MTVPVRLPPDPTATAERRQPITLQAAVLVVGSTVLVLRPLVAARLGWTTTVVAVLFTGLLIVSVAVPLGTGPRRELLGWVPGRSTVLLIGGAVFVAARLLGGGHPPGPLTLRVVALNSLAAVAEEALFRRVAFKALQGGGVWWAVGGSAVLFGLVHVTVYGWWAFPIDLAAGLVLGWQRLASGTWSVPAVTHVLADLLVVI
jgi:membrane protease YdiL (CAAX protease family)